MVATRQDIRRPRLQQAGLLALGLAILAAAGLTAALRERDRERRALPRDSAGSVRFVKGGEVFMDPFTASPSREQQTWMREHYWRMRTYAPYFHSRLSWFPNAWTYKDAYAIYPGSTLASGHDRFVLRDGAGNPLYIPWGCESGTCPQLAGDVGNREFRAAWIDEARSQLSHGYKGLHIDDVNMIMRVSDVRGSHVTPIDPRTGAPMTEEAWRRSMADFMEEVRAAFPDHEIVHNAIWFAGDDDPHIRRQIAAADYFNLERGVNDAGLTGRSDPRHSLHSLLAFVDRRHAGGRAVIFDSNPDTPEGRMYGLAAYFLVSTGRDGLGTHHGGTPADWWTGYDVELGEPKGRRYDWRGVIRRDFERGIALVNEPGEPPKTLPMPAGTTALDGAPRASVTLPPASGEVVLSQPPAAAVEDGDAAAAGGEPGHPQVR